MTEQGVRTEVFVSTSSGTDGPTGQESWISRQTTQSIDGTDISGSTVSDAGRPCRRSRGSKKIFVGPKKKSAPCLSLPPSPPWFSTAPANLTRAFAGCSGNLAAAVSPSEKLRHHVVEVREAKASMAPSCGDVFAAGSDIAAGFYEGSDGSTAASSASATSSCRSNSLVSLRELTGSSGDRCFPGTSGPAATDSTTTVSECSESWWFESSAHNDGSSEGCASNSAITHLPSFCQRVASGGELTLSLPLPEWKPNCGDLSSSVYEYSDGEDNENDIVFTSSSRSSGSSGVDSSNEYQLGASESANSALVSVSPTCIGSASVVPLEAHEFGAVGRDAVAALSLVENASICARSGSLRAAGAVVDSTTVEGCAGGTVTVKESEYSGGGLYNNSCSTPGRVPKAIVPPSDSQYRDCDEFQSPRGGVLGDDVDDGFLGRKVLAPLRRSLENYASRRVVPKLATLMAGRQSHTPSSACSPSITPHYPEGWRGSTTHPTRRMSPVCNSARSHAERPYEGPLRYQLGRELFKGSLIDDFISANPTTSNKDFLRPQRRTIATFAGEHPPATTLEDSELDLLWPHERRCSNFSTVSGFGLESSLMDLLSTEQCFRPQGIVPGNLQQGVAERLRLPIAKDMLMGRPWSAASSEASTADAPCSPRGCLATAEHPRRERAVALGAGKGRNSDLSSRQKFEVTASEADLGVATKALSATVALCGVKALCAAAASSLEPSAVTTPSESGARGAEFGEEPGSAELFASTWSGPDCWTGGQWTSGFGGLGFSGDTYLESYLDGRVSLTEALIGTRMSLPRRRSGDATADSMPFSDEEIFVPRAVDVDEEQLRRSRRTQSYSNADRNESTRKRLLQSLTGEDGVESNWRVDGDSVDRDDESYYTSSKDVGGCVNGFPRAKYSGIHADGFQRACCRQFRRTITGGMYAGPAVGDVDGWLATLCRRSWNNEALVSNAVDNEAPSIVGGVTAPPRLSAGTAVPFTAPSENPCVGGATRSRSIGGGSMTPGLPKPVRQLTSTSASGRASVEDSSFPGIAGKSVTGGCNATNWSGLSLPDWGLEGVGSAQINSRKLEMAGDPTTTNHSLSTGLTERCQDATRCEVEATCVAYPVEVSGQSLQVADGSLTVPLGESQVCGMARQGQEESSQQPVLPDAQGRRRQFTLQRVQRQLQSPQSSINDRKVLPDCPTSLKPSSKHAAPESRETNFRDQPAHVERVQEQQPRLVVHLNRHRKGVDTGPTFWGMWDDERCRMLYVSWLPRAARAIDRTGKKTSELVLKDFISNVLGFSGLHKVILFPPSSAHCKLLFYKEAAARAFLDIFGGFEGTRGPSLWKTLICRFFRVDIRSGICNTRVRIIWADQTKNEALERQQQTLQVLAESQQSGAPVMA